MRLHSSQLFPSAASSRLPDVSETYICAAPRQHAGQQRGFNPLKSSSSIHPWLQSLSPRRSTQIEAAISLRWQGSSGGTPEQWQRSAAAAAATSSQRQREPMDPAERPLKINLDLLHYRARIERQKAMRYGSPKERAAAIAKAEDLLRQCQAKDPSDGRAYVSLGRIYVMQQRYQEAKDLYEEGTRLTESKNAYIWAAWAYLEGKQGDVKAARTLYDAATVADSEHAAAWHGWGLLEKRQGNIVRARDLWMKVPLVGIRRTQNNPSPYLYQSVAQLAADMGLTDEARKWFQRGTSTFLGQASHALWVSWALMEARQGDATAVRYLFKRGIEVGPRSRYLHLAWAMWEKQNGNFNNARKLLERGQRLNPRDAPILQANALLEEEADNVEAARKLFARGAKADPRALHVWQAWGVMEFRRGNVSRARELFQEGVWADPDNRDVAYVWQAWGVLESQAGNYQLARQLFRCAVKAYPQSEPSWKAWAQMEENLGFLQRADDLRRYSIEEQQEVVAPRSFAEPSEVLELEPILQQVSRWFQRFEAARSPARPSRRTAGDGIQSRPSWLAPDGDKLERPQNSRSRGPAYPAAAAQAAAAASRSAANGRPRRPLNGSPGADYMSDSSDEDGSYDGGSDLTGGLSSILSPEEVADMQRMADLTDLDLPDVRMQSPPRR